MVTSNSTSIFSNSGLHSAGMKVTFFALVLLATGCAAIKQPVDNPPPIVAATHAIQPVDDPPPPIVVATHAIQPCTNCAGTVFVGDSIFGRLATSNTFINQSYVDAGVFGQRTDEILARFADTISGANVCHGYNPPAGVAADPNFPYVCSSLPEQVKTVVILAGWNNMFQGANVAYVTEMAANIQRMVSMALAKGIKVVVCTVYAYDPGLPASWMVPTGNAPVTFYDMWRVPLNNQIAGMQNVTVVDLSAVFAGQTNYTIDGVHPTDGGNAQMLNAIIPNL